MVRSGRGLTSPTVLVFSIGLAIAMSGTSALSHEPTCRQLEELARQYVGVRLTSQQQQLKRRLVAWYNGNCKRTQSVRR